MDWDYIYLVLLRKLRDEKQARETLEYLIQIDDEIEGELYVS